MRLRLRIRSILFFVAGAVLMVPVAVFLGLEVYDVYLMRQTERQLAAQSVVIGEAWRDAWLEARGIPADRIVGDDDSGSRVASEIRSPKDRDERYSPIHPRIDLGVRVLPPQTNKLPARTSVDSDAAKAGLAVSGMVERTKIFNLSAIRVLDKHGCVVATTGGEPDRCLHTLPEIKSGLSGRYAAVARRRVSDEPLAPLNDLRRRGRTRIFTALPIFHNGEVIGVVRASRTSLSAIRSLWLNRRGVVVGGGITVLAALVIVSLSALAIARPLRRVTQTASRIRDKGLSSVADSSGWLPHELSILDDVLREMASQLEGKAEYTAVYAANISHELKTPLTSVRGAAELLADGWSEMSDAQRDRFLRNIQEDAKRMEALVRDLLTLARIENAPKEQNATSVDLAAFFSELSAVYGSQLQVNVNAKLGTLSIDPNYLRSAICNLIDNAFQWSPDAVSVMANPSHDQKVCIQVIDQGPGIPADKQEKIFDRFYSSRRDEGGTGLGLAIVRAIAESRDGNVTVESTPGNTVFTLIL